MLTQEEGFVIAGALNSEAKRFDELLAGRQDIHTQTAEIWRNAAAIRRDLARRVLVLTKGVMPPEQSATSGIGKLWWSTEDKGELDQWLDGILKPCRILSIEERPRSDPPKGKEYGVLYSVVFSLPIDKAAEILGYEPDMEEWLVDE